MNITVNEKGHIQTSDGRNTEIEVFHCPIYYVGNSNHCISFASMVLDDGRVVLHSALHSPDSEIEDFLYEVVERHEAPEAACSMVEDAEDYLLAQGVPQDGLGRITVFLDRLENELKKRLH